MKRSSASVAADPKNVRELRRTGVACLERWGLRRRLDLHGVELLISEIVTSTLDHPRGETVTLTLTYAESDRELRIEVGDRTPGQARVRGVFTMAAVARAWGTSHGGARTWCTVPVVRDSYDWAHIERALRTYDRDRILEAIAHAESAKSAEGAEADPRTWRSVLRVLRGSTRTLLSYAEAYYAGLAPDDPGRETLRLFLDRVRSLRDAPEADWRECLAVLPTLLRYADCVCVKVGW
ncbi:hypothetical protein LRS74_12880 [Streptomyces sp. LX-29]|uniref:ATP-binding protein n=1 Tax=Streptomyces sp. LX-29 TaxID=2900152 RepID=UPI00240D3FDC|nr:hypothetical protein [Streptomyces sp. LX-29]WFB07839.1 hypothetical protein LRS74_12880 [Streptomyces sp. LX-29]